MKKLMLLPLLMISCLSLAQDEEAIAIIGKTIKIEKFEVAQNDFSHPMNWDEAKAECAKLGNRWRLPTKNELNVMYKNKKKIGGFANKDWWSKYYWSSTELNKYLARVQNFNTGEQYPFAKDNSFNVRAVRAY